MVHYIGKLEFIYMRNNHTLLSKLKEYSQSNYYGFHMPGHKRNIEEFGRDIPYGIDITEIEGFDDLHHCEGVLLDSQLKATRVFHAEETFYLINGSTCGNIAAIMSVTEKGDKILIARNNHKSVYNAVYMQSLKPVYIYPEFDKKNGINGEIKKEIIQEMLLSEEDIKAVVIVSPTYDGVISDIQGIAEVVHTFGIPLIVDEAHGAHLGLSTYFGTNSNELGADLVVHSLHKTLPSLTQTGLLHCNGNIVNRDKLRRYLKMLQSSSPSYVLMASIDQCVNIIEQEGNHLFESYVEKLDKVRNTFLGLKNLQLVELDNYDRSKILISTRDTLLSGRKLYEILLDKYQLQMEMCGIDYVVAMTSIGDTEAGFTRLVNAILEIDNKIEQDNKSNKRVQRGSSVEDDFEVIVRIHNISDERQKNIQDNHRYITEQVSEWFYYVYPPGIPLVVPGEIITDEIKNYMDELVRNGFEIQKG